MLSYLFFITLIKGFEPQFIPYILFEYNITFFLKKQYFLQFRKWVVNIMYHNLEGELRKCYITRQKLTNDLHINISNVSKKLTTPISVYDDNNTDKYYVIARFDTLEGAKAALKEMCGSIAEINSHPSFYEVTDYFIVDWVTPDCYIIDTKEAVICLDIWSFDE